MHILFNEQVGILLVDRNVEDVKGYENSYNEIKRGDGAYNDRLKGER